MTFLQITSSEICPLFLFYNHKLFPLMMGKPTDDQGLHCYYLSCNHDGLQNYHTLANGFRWVVERPRAAGDTQLDLHPSDELVARNTIQYMINELGYANAVDGLPIFQAVEQYLQFEEANHRANNTPEDVISLHSETDSEYSDGDDELDAMDIDKEAATPMPVDTFGSDHSTSAATAMQDATTTWQGNPASTTSLADIRTINGNDFVRPLEVMEPIQVSE